MYLVLLLPFYKISTKESLGVRKPKGHLSWPWCFCNEEKRAAAQSHLTAAGNDAIKKLFPYQTLLCYYKTITYDLDTELLKTTVVASLDHDCVPLYFFFFVSFFFLCVSINRRSTFHHSVTKWRQSDSKSCDIPQIPYCQTRQCQSHFHLCFWYSDGIFPSITSIFGLKY